MPTSTVPAVWTGLHALFTAALDVPVHYGPPMTETGDFLCVGYDDGGPAVTADNEWAALGQQRQEERWSLTCLIWCASGDTDMTSRVTAAYALLSTCSEALAADYTVGNLCRIAHVADHSLTPEQDASGSSVRLSFTVNVAARI
jgi:hypothetical protein